MLHRCLCRTIVFAEPATCEKVEKKVARMVERLTRELGDEFGGPVVLESASSAYLACTSPEEGNFAILVTVVGRPMLPGEGGKQSPPEPPRRVRCGCDSIFCGDRDEDKGRTGPAGERGRGQGGRRR